LDSLKVKSPVGRKNFAVVGVAGPDWERHASRLSSAHNVEVISCSAQTIHAELPEFLIKLAQGADEIRSRRKPSAEPQLAQR
jgi:hypothetical protein